MEVIVVLTLMFICVRIGNAEETLLLPLLNNGDVHLENLTDSYVVLTWKMNEVELANITNPLRLLIHLETQGKPSIYLTPDYDDRLCSIQISQCQLSFLTHDTKYRVIVSIDDVKQATLLGYAIIEFTTHSVGVNDGWMLKVFLFLILPAFVGFIIIVVTIIIVCAKCCHCLCWRKKQRKDQPCPSSRHQSMNELSGNMQTGSCSRQHSVMSEQSGNRQEARMSDHYDEAYHASDFRMYHEDTGRYLPIVSEQQRPACSRHQMEMTGHSNNDSSTLSSRHTQQLYLDEIIAQQQQQQHQQHQQQQRHELPRLHNNQRSNQQQRYPSAQPKLDNDGYLDVVDYSGSSVHYTNGLNVL